MPSSSRLEIKALVTGGAGFIGGHIAQALVARGAKVVVLDDLSTGDPVNLAWAGGSNSVEFVKGCVSDSALVKKLVQGCDWVFHEGAIASVPQSVAQPVESSQVNLDASLGLLVAARDAKVKRFMFASSAAIYGDTEAPLKHESDPVLPLTPYGLQKYASERYGQMFHQLYGLETVALRYFNVFGPRQSFNSPYSGVIARFCTLMLRGEPPTIFGDGLQSRDFAYIDNVVAANLLAAERPAENVAGRVFNIAGGTSVTLLDLIAELNKLTGQSIVPKHEPGRCGDIRHSAADLTASRTDLAYEPQVTWQEGLKHTLDFYRV
ncbi:NAD-dependent epimerase/dehydratase family protein [Brevifollis gellanilyticus]|uniref:NAD-dependent epimerase/dehydratase family protein n=1 Tax=Brevifollis gellanilyticus TaxID=748831 RepID=UPI0014790CDD|nr:NAD-dependent epimerase/dehydratase family protein [Brevifollis gellanilyticus]